MAIDLDNSIDVCLACRQRFGSIAEAREVFRELGFLTVDQSDAIARKRQLDPMTIRGLVIVSRYACMSLDWLEYHHQPLTKWHLQQLEAEFKENQTGTAAHFQYFFLGRPAFPGSSQPKRAIVRLIQRSPP